ncbi:MAG: hypothetical protein RBT11_05745 [Desulfobacterales bacterium]|jgi:hypothetical protein|nr:hypothetical protein [Desulfobacterales bacterium]
MADIPNDTDIQPVIQISEAKKNRKITGNNGKTNRLFYLFSHYGKLLIKEPVFMLPKQQCGIKTIPGRSTWF